MPNSKIEHIFILMLENHSFDNIFGFSGIPGLRGLNGTESNSYGHTFRVQKGALDAMPADPGHEFADTLEQLCGPNADFYPFGSYPAVNNSGFVSNFATSHSEDTGDAPHPNPGQYEDVMRCFDTPNQLPVMYQLATEFGVCDNWFSSLPGPTWPNRFFAYAASSASLDDSPSALEMAAWESLDGGIVFPNGSIFDLLRSRGYPFRLYQEHLSLTSFPIVLGLNGISYKDDMHDLSEFEKDLKHGYPYPLTVIEPNYGDTLHGTFRGGSSQHPMDGMAAGENLIKNVYEAIRGVPEVWEKSLLIITYDEHGGFYDSVAPPAAPPPNDGSHPGGQYSTNGFLFNQYGVRVPAVVVSPYIPKNTVCHTLFDHTSMLKTVEELLGLPSLTDRDNSANSLLPLLTEDHLRTDCPETLGAPAAMAATQVLAALPTRSEQPEMNDTPLPERGNIYGFLAIAGKVAHELSSGAPEGFTSVVQTLPSLLDIKTIGQAADYMNAVLQKARAV
ncbi:MAG TPA: alkaline phosphatase family protein [Flavilitoribacter sp.]|nr:alkaline phosphatase family protein [Flavilitoribacter sp.]HMQ86400.1 alkaline phosphatase family protein [Flavilitoribacter sp.]